VEEQKYTVDPDTFASNPGGIRLNPFVWLASYPKWPLILAVLLTLSIYLATLHLLWLLLLIPVVGLNALYWQRQREHFGIGDMNPGIVVSESPVLFAVRTDLTKSFGTFPVVKVVQKSFRPVRDPALRVGTRIMTVALYSPGGPEQQHLPHWVDFSPVPVDCATRDAAAVERAFRTATEEDWQELELALQAVSQPYVAGLYPIDVDESSWADHGTGGLATSETPRAT